MGLIGRVGKLVLVVWGAVTLVFLVGRVLPVDPAVVRSGANASPQMIEATRHALGLDRPLLAQYADYMSHLVQGNLGRSTMTGRDVTADLAARLPASLELVTAATLLALFAAAALAVPAAVRPGGILDRVGRGIASLGTAIPMFFAGVLLIFCFYVLLPVAPAPFGRLGVFIEAPPRITGLLVVDSIASRRWDALLSSLHHLLLPTLTLALAIFPQIFHVFRSSIAQALRSDAVRALERTELSRGLLWRRYIIPLALGPLISLLAASFGYLIGGTVLIEHIFGWNGLGAYAVQGIHAGDYNVVQGVVLISSLAYALAFFAADLILWRIDPRLSEKEVPRARFHRAA